MTTPRVGLAMINQYTKFEFPTCTHKEAMNGGAKCTNWEFGAVRGHSRSLALSPFDRAHSHLTLETMHLSCTVFEI